MASLPREPEQGAAARRAWRLDALRLHPDRNPGDPTAAERFAAHASRRPETGPAQQHVLVSLAPSEWFSGSERVVSFLASDGRRTRRREVAVALAPGVRLGHPTEVSPGLYLTAQLGPGGPGAWSAVRDGAGRRHLRCEGAPLAERPAPDAPVDFLHPDGRRCTLVPPPGLDVFPGLYYRAPGLGWSGGDLLVSFAEAGPAKQDSPTAAACRVPLVLAQR